MCSGEELLCAGAHPFSTGFGACVTRVRAGAGTHLPVEAIWFCLRTSLSCASCFINRRHLHTLTREKGESTRLFPTSSAFLDFSLLLAHQCSVQETLPVVLKTLDYLHKQGIDNLLCNCKNHCFPLHIVPLFYSLLLSFLNLFPEIH